MRQIILFSVIIIVVVSFMGLVEQAGAAPPWRFDANTYENTCDDEYWCGCDDVNDIAISVEASCPTGYAIRKSLIFRSGPTGDASRVECAAFADGVTLAAPWTHKTFCLSVK